MLDTEVAAPWTEDTVRQCLFLYLSLLPLNHQLVHELASVYTEAIADIKRSVLRAIEQPVSPVSLWHVSTYFITSSIVRCIDSDICFLVTGVIFDACVASTEFLYLKSR